MESCQHLSSFCTPKGIQRLSRVAETVFSATNRPVVGIGSEGVPKCLHPDCIFPASRDVHVCVQCVYMSCFSPIQSKPDDSIMKDDDDVVDGLRSTHVYAHFQSSDHFLFLSVEYGHLFCVKCEDFVFNRFLESALALQSQIAESHRRRFTSSISPLDTPVRRQTSAENSLTRTRGKKRRLTSVDGWTPTARELERIAAHAMRFAPAKTKVSPPVGLFNLGNSCYMNSVLQAFLNAPPLRNFFLADEHRPFCKKEPKSDCLACAYDRLVCDSCFTTENIPWKEKNGSATSLAVPFLVPQSVLDIMWRNAEHLATYAQHDAHEFLIAALNVLNSHCRREKEVMVPLKAKEEPILASEDQKKDSSQTNRTPESKTKVSPVSPVANVRADPGGEFLKGNLLSGHSTISIVQNLFSGTLQSDVICQVCGNSSPTLERFFDISLDFDKFVKPASTRRSRAQSPATEMDTGSGIGMQSKGNSALMDDRIPRRKDGSSPDGSLSVNKVSPDAANGSLASEEDKDMDTANTLQECLSRFTEPEMLGASSKMHCMKCKTSQEAMKQMSIRTLPPVICFHFKRFKQSFASIRRSEMVKIDTAVEFPADGLNLSSFRTSAVLQNRQKTKLNSQSTTVESALVVAMEQKLSEAKAQKPKEMQYAIRDGKEALYDLFAVVNHNGRIDSGHYTTIVRKKGEWFRCDDEKVTTLPTMDRVIRSEEAYLVFYAQRHPNVQF